MDRERGEQLMTEALFAREILRIGEECVTALSQLNQSLILCMDNPLMVPVAQQHLISALQANEAVVDLCRGRAKMIEREINDSDV